jgi:hypothetical protein
VIFEAGNEGEVKLHSRCVENIISFGGRVKTVKQ